MIFNYTIVSLSQKTSLKKTKQLFPQGMINKEESPGQLNGALFTIPIGGFMMNVKLEKQVKLIPLPISMVFNKKTNL